MKKTFWLKLVILWNEKAPQKNFLIVYRVYLVVFEKEVYNRLSF